MFTYILICFFKVPGLLGFFRDQKRRIDAVIVVDDIRDKEINLVKDVFFRNCLNAGLECELETGVVSWNYLFIVCSCRMWHVHARESIY